MATIREILSEDRRTASRRSLPDLAPEGLASHLVARPKRGPKKARKTAAKKAASPGDRIARLKVLRPRPRHAFWLAAFALVWVWPMLVLATLFVGFWLVVLGAAVFGLERMKDLRDKSLDALPRFWALPRDWPVLRLRREAEPDPFEHRPDPFERISPEPH